ncbi:32874_t:CDS:2, partial [Gigaspora margarita]
ETKPKMREDIESIVLGISELMLEEVDSSIEKDLHEKKPVREINTNVSEEERKWKKEDSMQESQKRNQLYFTIWDVLLEFNARHIRRCLSIFATENGKLMRITTGCYNREGLLRQEGCLTLLKVAKGILEENVANTISSICELATNNTDTTEQVQAYSVPETDYRQLKI